MITHIRTLSQQLAEPSFDDPAELVAWMGAVQAQDYNSSKWAVGIRLRSATLNDVNKALEEGRIIRTHVLRPTWHLVAAQDIRWMLRLSAPRIRMAYDSYEKSMKFPEELHDGKACGLLQKMLEGNKSMTKQEIETELSRAGISAEPHQVNRILGRAELDGVLCSGVDKAGKSTYALLDERVPPAPELHKEEALARLATAYFRSHSPATVQDFSWWSGLSLTEAKQAIGLIRDCLIADKFSSYEFFVHQSYGREAACDNVAHLLPPYDEYLISYKDRSAVLDTAHYHKAFNNFGIFYPVIKYNGRIIGNWKKAVKKGKPVIETSFFKENQRINKKLMEAAERKVIEFLSI